MTTEEQPTTRQRVRRIAGYTATVAAFLLVLFALVAPNQIGRLTPLAFVRLPLEGLLGVAVLLILPPRPRRVLAIVGGAFLGLLTIVKIIDMGFYAVLSRPFDLVLDWTLFSNAMDFVKGSAGGFGAIAAVVVVAALVAAAIVLMILSVLRLSRVIDRHRRTTIRTVGVLALVWVVGAVTNVHFINRQPIAARTASALVAQRAAQINLGLHDQERFKQESAVDAFRDTASDKLLASLRGKDVIFTFIESYGRSAVEDPQFASQVGAVLAAGEQRLGAAGYAARSGFLTSPTSGGGSWLAHATLLSGLWIDNEQRYRNLVSSDRVTIGSAFRRANWRTVGLMPANDRAWPEGTFFGYDRVYDSRNLGYRGPKFSFAPMPDQYALSVFERNERAGAGRTPLMAELELISSHAPWAPLPQLVDWDALGDGSIFGPIAAAGHEPNSLWTDPGRVRVEYRKSIEYSLNTLIEYIERYGNENLVLVFLGDHQAAPIVVGEDASRDVPITIVAHDRSVLDRVSSWGWTDGLKPSPQAPVWKMSEFRDKFLGAFNG